MVVVSTLRVDFFFFFFLLSSFFFFFFFNSLFFLSSFLPSSLSLTSLPSSFLFNFLSLSGNEMLAYVVASVQRDLETMRSRGWISEQSYNVILAELGKGSMASPTSAMMPSISGSGSGTKIAVPVAAALSGYVPAPLLPDKVEVDSQQAMALGNQAAKFATMERAKALYDFAGEQPGDLKFKTGDVIEIVSKDSPEWWTGRLNGVQGTVPATYLELLKTHLATGKDAMKGAGSEVLKNSGGMSSFAKGKIF